MDKNKKNGIIDGTLTCKEEEKNLMDSKVKNIKVNDLPINPNLSE